MRYIDFTLDFAFIPQDFYVFLPNPKKKVSHNYGPPLLLAIIIMGFLLFLWFSPISQKLGPTAKNGFQIQILHLKIHKIKEKSRFYIPLNLNNTNIYAAHSLFKLHRIIIVNLAFPM